MARSRTTWKKGEGGRPPAVPNKTTKETKQILISALGCHVDNINSALTELKEKDIKAYLEVIAKLLPFILPKQNETDIKGNLPFKVVFDGDSGRDSTEETSRETS